MHCVAEYVRELALRPEAVKQYVEFHIEQGPVLAAKVRAGAGQAGD